MDEAEVTTFDTTNTTTALLTVPKENSTDESRNGTAHSPLDSPRYFFAACLLLVVVVGVIGNGLVIVVTTMDKKLRTLSHMLIAALSAVDFIICALCLPMCVIRLMKLDDEPLVCFYISFFSPIMTIFSTQIQALLGIVRHKLTISQGGTTLKFKRGILIALGTCLFFDMALYFSFVAPSGHIKYIPSLGLCVRRKPVFRQQPIAFVILFYTAAVVAFTFYFRLRNYVGNFSMSSDRKQRRQRRLSSLLFRLFMAWVTGYSFVIVIRFLDKQKSLPDFLYQLAYYALWGNSCINPIMYNSNNSGFSAAFRRLMNRCPGCRINPRVRQTSSQVPVLNST